MEPCTLRPLYLLIFCRLEIREHVVRRHACTWERESQVRVTTKPKIYERPKSTLALLSTQRLDIQFTNISGFVHDIVGRGAFACNIRFSCAVLYTFSLPPTYDHLTYVPLT